MCTFKVSKKPNDLNLQFKFAAPPLEALKGETKKLRFVHIYPPRFITVYALGGSSYRIS